MKVIGAGFARTGTMSLKVALEELGAGPCLHSLESLRDRDGQRHVPYWRRLADGEQIDWGSELAGWESVVDWPGARFYPEMLRAWPQAKVILSVREPQAWYESCYASLHASRTPAVAAQAGGARSSMLDAIDGLIFRDVFDGRFEEREHALEVFDAHRRRVVSAVPAERLLIYDTAEGWEPLCELLQVPVPETPFPHLNGRHAFWARFGLRPAAAGVDVASASTPGSTQATGRGASTRPRRAGTRPPSQAIQTGVPRIAGLALAHPQSTLTQEQTLQLLDLAEDAFAQRIFSAGRIERRRLHLTCKLAQSAMQGRTAVVEEQLLQLAADAVAQLNVEGEAIGTVITSSLYSLGCPSLAHRLIEHMEIDPATDKYHLTAIGCASAVPLIRLATRTLSGHPGRQALIVAAESMSGILAARRPEDPRSKTIGSSIFGDGCAAMLLDERPGAVGPQIIASKVHQVPGTLDAVSLELGERDSYLQLSKELPDVAGACLGELVDAFLAEQGITGHMIDHWLVHPGGRRILESAQRALKLADEQIELSFDVLANHGNTGTPSIFYVLQRTIAQRAPGKDELGLIVTVGPGVTIGLMLIRW